MHNRSIAAIVVWLLLPGLAAAGAWTQPEGKGQVILSGSIGISPAFGVANDVGETESSFTSLFAEYGVIEGLTVGGTAFIELPEGETADNTSSIGLLLRKRLWQGPDGDVASAQIGYVRPIDGIMGDRFGGPGADPTEEVSFRLLYGRGFGGDWGTAFVSTEGGYHLQLDDDDDELRFDVTAGYGPDPCCLAMLSLFSTIPLGGMEDAALKLAPSFAYTFRNVEAEDREAKAEGRKPADDPATPLTLQIGISQDLLNIEDGFGVQFSVWRPF